MFTQCDVHVNDIYLAALHNANRYLVLYGGAGSGKSVFASQKVLSRVMMERGHRILVVRKVAATLRESVFKRFVAEIMHLGVGWQFECRQSTLTLRSKLTGSEIITAGLDDVMKLKSMERITGIWIEEATELTEADFDNLDLRLRGVSDYYKQIILSFNPIDEGHWLKRRFFDTPAESCSIYKSTYLDNQFIDDEYRLVLERKMMLNPNLYRVYCLGEWGREEVQRPYAYNFDKDKHVKPTAVFCPGLPVYLSIDFNVEPFICLCAHVWLDGNGHHLHVFKELVIERNGDVYKMLDLITSTFNLATLHNLYVTGDAMQRKREITQRENIDAWTIIENRLRLGRRLMLPRANPSVKDNRHLINAILAFHTDVQINPDCKRLIFDMQYVESDEEGNLIKTNRQKQHQRSDALDTFRYLCNTYLPDFIRKYAPVGKL